ncbi:hypothetical protein ASG37_06780 [Sphingomonas sp. Leaf407]|uniref:S9 family peptidase n=1 Tax=unclassified Sphingomonas TaxID=196159 RepID=UPI0007016AD7|nr:MULTISPECIES: DPP IV N-terminal domain-containing protein [unclassified Sphingomonas]KQN39287.1 hypothetical protein ASE97_04070 [Sphingomonas sp. Leaf42]KQT28563.1 hypothetical protein ASG37_06780 [Sphingomonas sp. Leaf407]
MVQRNIHAPTKGCKIGSCDVAKGIKTVTGGGYQAMARTLCGTALGGLALATATMAPARPSGSGVRATAGAPRPVASIAERYALADRFQRPAANALFADGDVRATFTDDSRFLLYWTGVPGRRTLRRLELATGTLAPLTDEATLARLLAAAIAKPVDAEELSIEDPVFESAKGVLRFGAFDKRWQLAPDGTLAEAATGAPDGEGAVSPDGRFEIVARDFNLFARDRRSKREVALTTDGTREQPYGRSIPQLADILKAGTEDPVMPVSVAWSPDSRTIVTWRLDTRGVKKLSITQENPPGSFYPRSFQYIYPLAGAEKLPQATRFAVDVERALKRRRARLVPLAIPSESILYPIPPDLGWHDGKPQMAWTERGYGQVLVYRADPETGAARMIAREAVRPLVTVTSSFFRAAPELGGVLSVSERSGWAQLYLVKPDAPDGGTALTTGAWEVIGIEHVDAKRGSILLTGVGREGDRNPYYRAAYRVGSDGASPPVLLTPEPLDHDVAVSKDGRWMVDAMSAPTIPTRTVVRDAADGRIVAELARADDSALRATGFVMPETFRGVAADGRTPIYGMIWRPVGFDPTRSYPVIEEVYTGPTTTQVPTTWTGAVAARQASLAQVGAIVVSVDGTGTSRRGQAFRLPAYRNLGEVGLDDHIALIRQMAARYPYMDVSRVGVYGGSAGGYDAARFVLRRPAFYKVAVAWAGNHELRLDKAWWPEVSMGYADQATWDRNSNLSVAGNLRGKLLLGHGDIDDNVPVTETMRLADALIQSGRDVDLLILPNSSHRPNRPFYWRKMRDYFVRNLLDEAPPPFAPPVAAPPPFAQPAPATATAGAR